MAPHQVLEHFAKRNKEGIPPGRVLVRAADLVDMLEGIGGFKLTLRALKTYSSSRLKLLPPPVQKDDRQACYVFPDHFDRLGLILTLRQGYHLPLKAIQELLEHYPAEHYHLIIERKLSLEDILDLAKMLRHGFQIRDLIMAKTCDVMVQDALSSSQALSAATEPGDALRKLQEKAIIGRLEEIKAWVSSGRRQEFLRRESAQDFKELAQRRLLGNRISRKLMARRRRRS